MCGDNAKRYIRSGVTDTNSIIWEKSSCALVSGTICADETNACTWTQVATGPDFNVGGQGQYRVTLNYVNGCFSRYFFNVYENKLNPTATSRDIICNTNGEIVVGTPADGSGYEYSLDGMTYQASNILPINTPNIYTVYIRSIVMFLIVVYLQFLESKLENVILLLPLQLMILCVMEEKVLLNWQPMMFVPSTILVFLKEEHQ